jgi:FixJ family two-component response regulator
MKLCERGVNHDVNMLAPPEFTVFIVEDDGGVRSALTMMIESFGWKASAFASAEAFLDVYTPTGKEFLIFDLHLAGMNGLALLEELRAQGNHMPAVLITARPDDTLVNQCTTAGAAAVLTKPFMAAELLQVIERAMR